MQMQKKELRNLEHLSRFNISKEALEYVKKVGLNSLVKQFKSGRILTGFDYKYLNWLRQAPTEFINMARDAYIDELDYYHVDYETLMYLLTFYDIDDQDDAKVLKWRSQAPKSITVLRELADKYHRGDYTVRELYEDYMKEIEEVFKYADFL